MRSNEAFFILLSHLGGRFKHSPRSFTQSDKHSLSLGCFQSGLFSCSSCFCGWARSAAFIADESLNSTALSLYPDSALSHIWLQSCWSCYLLLHRCAPRPSVVPALALGAWDKSGQGCFPQSTFIPDGLQTAKQWKPQMGDHTWHKKARRLIK